MIQFSTSMYDRTFHVTMTEADWTYDYENPVDNEVEYIGRCTGITVKNEAGILVLSQPGTQTYSCILKDTEFNNHDDITDEDQRFLQQGITNIYIPMIWNLLQY